MPSRNPQSVELLNARFEAWSKLYGRNLNQEAVELMHRLFGGTDPAVLADALDVACEASFHLPTPARIRAAINAVIEKRGFAQGVTDCDCKACGGTGHRVVERTTELYGPDSPHRIQRYAEKCPCHPAHRSGGRRSAEAR